MVTPDPANKFTRRERWTSATHDQCTIYWSTYEAHDNFGASICVSFLLAMPDGAQIAKTYSVAKDNFNRFSTISHLKIRFMTELETQS